MRPHFILLDDDPVFCCAMAATAESMDIDLETYYSLLDLGDLDKLEKFDGAILDFELGAHTARDIKTYLNPLLSKVPVTLVSGFASSIWDHRPDRDEDVLPKSLGCQKLLAQAIQNAALSRR